MTCPATQHNCSEDKPVRTEQRCQNLKSRANVIRSSMFSAWIVTFVAACVFVVVDKWGCFEAELRYFPDVGWKWWPECTDLSCGLCFLTLNCRLSFSFSIYEVVLNYDPCNSSLDGVRDKYLRVGPTKTYSWYPSDMNHCKNLWEYKLHILQTSSAVPQRNFISANIFCTNWN